MCFINLSCAFLADQEFIEFIFRQLGEAEVSSRISVAVLLLI